MWEKTCLSWLRKKRFHIIKWSQGVKDRGSKHLRGQKCKLTYSKEPREIRILYSNTARKQIFLSPWKLKQNQDPMITMGGQNLEISSGRTLPGEKNKRLIQSHKNTLLLADKTCTGKDFLSVVQLTSIYIIKMLIAI